MTTKRKRIFSLIMALGMTTSASIVTWPYGNATLINAEETTITIPDNSNSQSFIHTQPVYEEIQDGFNLNHEYDGYGDKAYAHLEYIANNIGSRATGTIGEAQTRDYIKEQFEKIGYTPTLQEFNSRQNKLSHNVIAVKQGTVDPERQIIIGAHYDSIQWSTGADDNASGVGVLLELAERLKDKDTPYTIVFVAFAAEEWSTVHAHKLGWDWLIDAGIKNEVWSGGSINYVGNMSDDEVKNTIAYVNLDTLASGDYLYVYGDNYDAEHSSPYRDMALKIADELGINSGERERFLTNVGDPERSTYPAGTCGNWSDHRSFKWRGIPYVYFDASNWEVGFNGWDLTELYGETIHNHIMDNLEFLNSKYPERIKNHLSRFVTVIEKLFLMTENDIDTALKSE